MKKQNADQFFRHVCNLQTLAGLSSYHEALELYKRLHRIEARMNRIFINECNGYSNLTEEQEEKRDAKVLKQVKDLLPGLKTIFLNGDPRGYSLKIKPEEREELRKQKKYQEADKIRDQIIKMGFKVEDK